ncbi:hypothetical protein EVAR_45729_1 [Eumeta japonica]|uniref:Ig-like domain-containing protein n=1 Tax=Eumeta variegata TaxID=151549 RepID=A0A4C1WV44_EUMVA|nr:hypothetical protein EVAR_45729_1 [Eumeta japonica]
METYFLPRGARRGDNVTPALPVVPSIFICFFFKGFTCRLQRLARSNQSQVVLTRVSFGLSGNFSCEVTADAPSFATSIVSNTMEVVGETDAVHGSLVIDLSSSVISPTQTDHQFYPPTAPTVKTSQHYYTPGDILRANCTAGPSRPPPTLAFFINDDAVRLKQFGIMHVASMLNTVAFIFSDSGLNNAFAPAPAPPQRPAGRPRRDKCLIKIFTHRRPAGGVRLAARRNLPCGRAIFPGQFRSRPAGEGLFLSELQVETHLWPAHYERGAPILRCEAKLADLYHNDAAVALYSENADPKIERVTSPGSASELPVARPLC